MLTRITDAKAAEVGKREGSAKAERVDIGRFLGKPMRELNEFELQFVAGGDRWCMEPNVTPDTSASNWGSEARGPDSGGYAGVAAEPGLGQIIPSPMTVVAPIAIWVGSTIVNGVSNAATGVVGEAVNWYRDQTGH